MDTTGKLMPADGLCVYINELLRIKYTPQGTLKLSKHDLRNILETCDCCSFAREGAECKEPYSERAYGLNVWYVCSRGCLSSAACCSLCKA